MKKILCILLSIWMVLAFVGCDPNNGNDIDTSSDTESDTMKDTNTETEGVGTLESEMGTGTKDPTRPDYSLITVDGNHYLVFDNVLNHTYTYPPQEAWVMFDSITEWKDHVTKGTLSDYAKAIIVVAFEKNDIGFKICNFNNLFVPVLPEDVVSSTVRWWSESYSFYIEVDETAYGYITCYTEEQYQLACDSSSNSHLYQTQYTLQSGNKMFTVYEGSNSNGEIEYMRMNCIEGDLYYSITLSNLTEKPSEEWLLSFGLTPYVENPTE